MQGREATSSHTRTLIPRSPSLSLFPGPPPLMESKEDVSHRDSGIMMQSGPDSPMPPLKDRSQAAYQQQQELEAQLEACLAELRKLCLREAEFTGRLPQEYPLRQGDKVPPVRRRIGTAFRLDEKTIVSQGLDPLSILERDLALQLQIAAAARHLYREENLSKHIKKHRKNLVLKEERKLKELESALNECRRAAVQEPRPSNTAPSEETQAPNHPAAQQLLVPGMPHSSLALPACSAPPLQHTGLPLTQCRGPEQEHAPMQNSPWMETSLVRPNGTPKKHSAERCHMPSSPAGTAMPACAQRTTETSPYHFIPIKALTLWRQAGSSGPQIPEMQARRRQSQSMRVDVSRDQVEPRGRSVLPRRCPTYYKVSVSIPTYSFPPSKPNLASNSIYHSSSKDSNSDISSITNAPPHGSSSPDIAFPRPVPLLSLKQPLPGCRGQHSAGPEAAYYYHTPQKGLLPPSCFPAVEYMSGREFCQGYPSLWAGSSAPVPYEQDKVQLYCQRWGPAQSKIMCTPSLKDHAPGSGRALSKLSVSEELKLWHERTKLRNLRPHSLEREGAFYMRNML